jgi:long-chain acyl-CoA synthetase
LDEEGFLYVLGRKDDVINVGGEKFLPKQVEDELVEILPDSVYCIIGVPDPEGVLGEIPMLAIEGEPRVSISNVREFLKGRVPDCMIPKRLFGLYAFPRTANGKIQRQLIRREAMETPSP